jgi:hypothetical protein
MNVKDCKKCGHSGRDHSQVRKQCFHGMTIFDIQMNKPTKCDCTHYDFDKDEWEL